MTPLHCASRVDTGKRVELLLTKQCDKDTTCRRCFSALYYAVKGNHLDTARVLLVHDVWTEARTADGYTALHITCMNGFYDMNDLLIRHGASIKTVTCRGETAYNLIDDFETRQLKDPMS